MRRKLRVATVLGIALIFSASAVAAGKKAKKKAEPAKKEQTDPALGAPAANPPGKIDVKCNLPGTLTVKVQGTPTRTAPAAKTTAKKEKTKAGPMINWKKVGGDMLLVLLFSILGLIVALTGYKVYSWMAPFDVVKELEVDQNTALGIVLGAIILGLCIIVAAAIASPA